MFQPRPYQLQAIASPIDFYDRGGEGNPVVVMPCGTGKSLVIAGTVFSLETRRLNLRYCVATHVKELIEQNADKLATIWPGAPIGLFSAGLKSKNASRRITFGGIQSMAKSLDQFMLPIHVLFIDEAHLLNPEDATQYMTFINHLKSINPHLRVIGYSATPWRMRMGYITDGGLFTHIVFNNSDVAGFTDLIRGGYLAPIYPRPTQTEFDISNVPLSKTTGDYNESALQAAVDKDHITYNMLKESLAWGANRKRWIAFTTGVEHAEHVAEMMRQMGIDNAAAIHSKLPQKERDRRIAAHRSGELRCAVTNNMLTTGYDCPEIDFLIMARPTRSTPLWVQMLGRPMRPAPGKTDGLVLDFARNTMRLGPIDDPVIPNPKGDKPGDMPVKICEACGTYNKVRNTHCDACGAPFDMSPKVTQKASELALMSAVSSEPLYEWFTVKAVHYYPHQKGENKPVLKVVYECTDSLQLYVEWIAFEAKRNWIAHDWWKRRHRFMEPPATVATATQYTNELQRPSRIRVWTNKKPYPEIVGHEFT